VVTGGVLKEGLPTIGIERVSVPEQFYKIILDKYKGNYKVIAFLIPNRETNDSFYDYVTSVDAIEAETGLDFFSSLPDTIENNLEASMDSRAWGKR
jgi:endonuclease G